MCDLPVLACEAGVIHPVLIDGPEGADVLRVEIFEESGELRTHDIEVGLVCLHDLAADATERIRKRFVRNKAMG